MNIENDTSSHPVTFRRRSWDPVLDCKSHKFVVQNTPPLSLRQFARSTITNSHAAEDWKPAGIYRAPVIVEDFLPTLHDSLPEIRIQPRKNSRLAWYPAGCNKYVRPASPDDSKEIEKPGRTRNDSPTDTYFSSRSKANKAFAVPWRPSGNRKYKQTPYFDAPSLRWSMYDIKESMAEWKPRTKDTSTNQK